MEAPDPINDEVPVMDVCPGLIDLPAAMLTKILEKNAVNDWMAVSQVCTTLQAVALDLIARTAPGNPDVLASAAQFDVMPAIKAALDAGADIAATSNVCVYVRDKNLTPLHMAVAADAPTAVCYLLKQGAPVDNPDWHITPLGLATLHAHPKMVNLLISEGGAGVNVPVYDFRDTPLHCAVQASTRYPNHRRLGCVESLIRLGANLEARNYWHCTPFHLAIMASPPEVVQALLDAGADHKAVGGDLTTDDAGLTVWHYLAQRAALSGDSPRARARHAATAAVADIVAALPGLDPSARTHHERTPLHFAAGKGQAFMVDFLLELPGVDVEAVCNQGRTPLAWTAVDFMELAPEVATTLLKNHNALPDAVRADGDTVLHTCVKWQNHGIAKLLLEHGADVTIRNPLGKTALECAQSDRDPPMRDPHMVDLIEKHIVEAALAAKAARHERRKARAARNERRKAKAARKEKAKEEVVEDAFLDPYGLD